MLIGDLNGIDDFIPDLSQLIEEAEGQFLLAAIHAQPRRTTFF
jgi:hypothetical protein